MPKIKVVEKQQSPDDNDFRRKYFFAEQYLITGNRLEASARVGEDLFEDFQTQEIIKEMQQTIKDRGLVTLDGHLEELALLRDLAKKDGKWSVALNAEIARGKVGGLYIERSTLNISDLTNASSSELRNQMEELARLIDRETNRTAALEDRRIIDNPIENLENEASFTQSISFQELSDAIRSSGGDGGTEETGSTPETEETSGGDATPEGSN
jgi:hypothetical protein